MVTDNKNNGIITLANDNTVDWLACLLGGLKRTGSSLPLAIIPYDEKIKRVEELISSYNNVFLFKPQHYGALASLGYQISGPGYFSRTFLKIASFWGPFSEFIFFDTDILLSCRPDDWLMTYHQQARDRRVVLADPSPEYVFRGRLRDDFEQRSRPACNTGFFIGRRGDISFEDLQELVVHIPDIARDCLLPQYGDQSFLNYALDCLGIHVSLISDIDKSCSSVCWAPQSVWKDSAGLLFYQISDSSIQDPDERISYNKPAFLHWAGLVISPAMANLHLFLEDALPAMSSSDRLHLIAFLFRENPKAFASKKFLILKRLLTSYVGGRNG